MHIASAIFSLTLDDHDRLLALALLTEHLVAPTVHFKAADAICPSFTISCQLGDTPLGLLHSLLPEALHASLPLCFELLGRDAGLTRLFHSAEPLHSLLLFSLDRLFCLDSEAFLALLYALF